MSSTDVVRLESILRQRCDPIARRWHTAIIPDCLTQHESAEVCRLLSDWSHQIVDLLVASDDAFDHLQARSVGASLAHLCRPHPQVLASTLNLLTQQLFRGLSTAQIAALRPRISLLESELAYGFIRRGQEMILAEQEQARQTVIQALQQTQEALVEHQNQLEELVEDRTRELIEANVQLEQEIIDRRQAQKALARSEEQYRSLVENSLQGIIIFQDDGIIYANPAIAEMLGYTIAELLALSPANAGVIIHPADRAFIIGRAAASLSGQTPPQRYRFRVFRKNGRMRWLEMSMGLIIHHDRPALQAFSVDVTEQERAERTLRQRNDQLEALRRVGLELTAQLDLDILLRSIVAWAIELLKGAAGGLYLYRPEQEMLEWVIAVGPNLSPVGVTLRRGQGLSGKVWETGEPLIVRNYRHWEGRAVQYEGYTWAAVVGVPICWGGEFLGVLNVLADRSDAFSDPDVELLELFAAQAAIAIQNARLYERIQREVEAKSTLLREVNHRIQNNLTAIIGLIQAEQRRAEVEDRTWCQAVMRDLVDRVHGLALINRLLATAEASSVQLCELTEQIVDYALRALPIDKRICVDVTPTPVRVTPRQAHQLALVVNELITNVIKYALRDRNQARVAVRIARDDGEVTFQFRDDGPGYPEDVLRGENQHVGLELIQNLVSKGLRGALDLQNDGGAVTTLRFEDLGGKGSAA